MAILGVCGDSFMSATINTDHTPCIDSEGKHFTEILAKKLNYDYFTLARGACSNFAIRLQIDEMIRQKVDLIICNTTSSNRIEIPNLGRKYKERLGVYNLDYQSKFYPDKSSLNHKFECNTITETLTNIFTDTRPFFNKIVNWSQRKLMSQITEEQILALKNFIDYLFDEEYKQVLDSYIMHSAIKSLEEAKIPFFMIINGVVPHNLLEKNLETDPRFILHKSKLNPYNWDKNGNRRWHTSDLGQEHGAKIWFDYLIKNNIKIKYGNFLV